MKASDLATALGGLLVNTADDIELSGVSTLSDATSSDVAFVTGKKFVKPAMSSEAGLIITSEKLPIPDRPLLVVKNVWSGVLQALKLFYPNFARKSYAGVHATAVIDATVRLGSNVSVGPYAVIGADTEIGDGCYIAPGVVIGARCRIGSDVTIYANAVIEDETRLGNRVFVQPGAVIGSDGFKYEILDGRWTKIPQVGHVELADNVEVGANTCIDRASYSVTAVGADTKIDNLVQIAHNARIGNNCVIVAQTGIAGSSTVGNNSILAAQAGVADNLTLGEQSILMARAAALTDLEGKQTYWGFPAVPFTQEARQAAARKKLPDLLSQVAKLSKRVAELEARLGTDEVKQD
jgi:UDP-3-O-[3-hydroxymyristoyl] glucosamine N-acyltransferase